MLYGGRKLKTNEFRKESSFSKIPPIKKTMLRLSPTSPQPVPLPGVEDYC
jgi:hypothetical protein